jgi:hypothetical protein
MHAKLMDFMLDIRAILDTSAVGFATGISPCYYLKSPKEEETITDSEKRKENMAWGNETASITIIPERLPRCCGQT